MKKQELIDGDYGEDCWIIEQKMESVFEVGAALERIKRTKSYKEEFKTWEEFCDNKINRTASYANRMISLSEN